MKTNKLLLFFAMVSIVFFTSCENKKTNCNNCPNTFNPPEGTFTYADEGRTKEMLNYTEIVTMLTNYDQTRIRPLEDALGYEDSRINNYNFKEFKKYLGYIENLSKKSKIKITGISFISAAKPNYKETGKSYQDLIYVPTTTINGKQVAFDPVQSVKQGKLVTFKEMLARNGYNWIYDSVKDFKAGKNKENNYKITKQQKKGTDLKNTLKGRDLSGAGNLAHLSPPY